MIYISLSIKISILLYSDICG